MKINVHEEAAVMTNQFNTLLEKSMPILAS
jgi:hypothetical protein